MERRSFLMGSLAAVALPALPSQLQLGKTVECFSCGDYLTAVRAGGCIVCPPRASAYFSSLCSGDKDFRTYWRCASCTEKIESCPKHCAVCGEGLVRVPLHGDLWTDRWVTSYQEEFDDSPSNSYLICRKHSELDMTRLASAALEKNARRIVRIMEFGWAPC